MANRIQIRHDTTANWTAANPIPLIGELCIDTTLNMYKIGDGVTAYSSLPWASFDVNSAALSTKILTVGGGAFAPLSVSTDVISLLTRMDAVEESGIVKSSVTPFTLTSNANVFTDLGTGSTYTLPAGSLAIGDSIMLSAICDMFNNSGGSVVFDIQFILGAFRLTGTPITAGFSIATAAQRRPLHIWIECTYATATTLHIASGIILTALKAAPDEIGLFNGTTTGFGAQASVSDASINRANAQTFKLQGKIRTNTALAEIQVIRPVWATSKGV